MNTGLLRSAVITSVLGLWLVSCAPISKNECLVGDWHTRGYQDGRAGKSLDRIGRYAESCSKHGVSADPIAYNAGHKVGVVEFCDGSVGYREGADNNEYQLVCPAELERDFLVGYLDGLDVARERLNNDLDRTRDRLSSLQQERSVERSARKVKSLDASISAERSKLTSLRIDLRKLDENASRWRRRL